MCEGGCVTSVPAPLCMEGGGGGEERSGWLVLVWLLLWGLYLMQAIRSCPVRGTREEGKGKDSRRKGGGAVGGER